jgi:hypothetical protein
MEPEPERPTNPPTSPAPVRKGWGLRLSRVSVAAAVLLLPLMIARVCVAGDVHIEELSDALAGFVAKLVGTWLFAELFYVLANRSRLVGNAAFCLIIGANVAVYGALTLMREPTPLQRAEQRELHAREVEGAMQTILESVEDGAPSDILAAQERLKQRLSAAARTTQGEERVIMEVIVQLVEEQQRASLPLERVTTRLVELDVLNFAGIESAESIDERIAALAKLERVCRELIETIGANRDRAEARLRARGVSERGIGRFLADMEETADTEAAITLRELDIEFSTTLIAVYEALRAGWGDWGVGPDGGLALGESFDFEVMGGSLEHLDAILVEQDALTRAYVRKKRAALGLADTP